MALRSQMIFRFCSFIHAYFGESLRLLFTQHELAWINSARVWALYRHSSWIYTCLRFARTMELAAILWEKFSRDNLNPFRTCDTCSVEFELWIRRATRDVDSSETSSYSVESFTFNISIIWLFEANDDWEVDAISRDIIYGFSHLTFGKRNTFKYSWFFSNENSHWFNGILLTHWRNRKEKQYRFFATHPLFCHTFSIVVDWTDFENLWKSFSPFCSSNTRTEHLEVEKS